MFDTHQPQIGDYARASADNMHRTIRFAIVSAHCRFPACVEACEDIERGREPNGAAVFGWKHAALDEARERKDAIYVEAMDIWDSGAEVAPRLVALFASMRGLGFVKAGFAAQLAFGSAGCLDTHNIQRLGLDPKALRARKLKPAGIARWSRWYCELCDRLGGCGTLWDEWCTYVAPRYTMSPSAVSAAHVRGIVFN